MDSAVPGQTTDEVHSSTVCETMKHKFWDSNLTWPNSGIILCDFTRWSDTNRSGISLLKTSLHVFTNAGATRYELDCPEFESLWRRDFRTRLDRLPWMPSLYPRSTAAGTWRWSPIQSSTEVKERVELYLYSSSGPSWFVRGWTLTLPKRLGFLSEERNSSEFYIKN